MARISKFTSPSGSYLTEALFWETSFRTQHKYAMYSLKKWDMTNDDGVIFPSIHQGYLEVGDVTEYDFAVKYFDGWDHWTELTQTLWFSDYLSNMRKELELKLRSLALRRIITEAQGGRSSFNANKFIVDRGWASVSPVINPRGRPTKDRIAEEARRIVDDESDVLADLRRIGIN